MHGKTSVQKPKSVFPQRLGGLASMSAEQSISHSEDAFTLDLYKAAYGDYTIREVEGRLHVSPNSGGPTLPLANVSVQGREVQLVVVPRAPVRYFRCSDVSTATRVSTVIQQ